MRQTLDEYADLSADLHGVAGLGGVMAWMASRGIPLSRAEIVQQDEFTLDFVVPLESDPRVLVFGIT
jgi:hypothetical protein